MKEKEYLFSYGTLQQENVQRALFGRLFVGRAESLLGYELSEVLITDPDVIHTSGLETHLILIESENASKEIQGMVFELTPDELVQADTYETNAYVRVKGQLKSGQQAWVYVAAN